MTPALKNLQSIWAANAQTFGKLNSTKLHLGGLCVCMLYVYVCIFIALYKTFSHTLFNFIIFGMQIQLIQKTLESPKYTPLTFQNFEFLIKRTHANKYLSCRESGAGKEQDSWPLTFHLSCLRHVRIHRGASEGWGRHNMALSACSLHRWVTACSTATKLYFDTRQEMLQGTP